MTQFSEWYWRQHPAGQAAIRSLWCAISLGLICGFAFGAFSAAMAGAFLGSIAGLISYYRERRSSAKSGEDFGDYPDELRAVDRRHIKQMLLILPVLWIVGIGVSWIAFGTGFYGVFMAVAAYLTISWLLARFGGPHDPKWRRLRDEWHESRLRTERN